MANDAIGDILKRLMFEKNIRPTELARKINVPQQTLQRIVTGSSPNPHLSTLLPIADFFSISIEQLQGTKPIPSWHKNNEFYKYISLISWHDVINWPLALNDDNASQQKIVSEDDMHEQVFALKMIDSAMEPLFPEKTILIFDPIKQAQDHHYVICHLQESTQILFRQLIINNSHYYLKALNPDAEQFPILKLGENDRICGTLVQARNNFVI
jgi:transcriptional regulator with XRE-family HTH domain